MLVLCPTGVSTCGGEGTSALTCATYATRRGLTGAPPSEWGKEKISGGEGGSEGRTDGKSKVADEAVRRSPPAVEAK